MPNEHRGGHSEWAWGEEVKRLGSVHGTTSSCVSAHFDVPKRHRALLRFGPNQEFKWGGMTMLATDVLRQEHRVIEKVLDCLVKLADACVADRKLDGRSARQIIDFLETFADECHHFKEENQLFPMMESRGFPRVFFPTTVLRSEHDLARRFLLVMSSSVEGAAAGNADDVQRFAGHAQAYARMMREHIRKEDQRLFPLANETLSDEDQSALLTGFEEAESKERTAGTHEKYVHLADELATRWGVPQGETAPCTPSACCGHACATP
jgi:hemerythrin-like domain-containing protein